jgi:hypothetical protein
MPKISTKTKHHYRERARSLLVQNPQISGVGIKKRLESQGPEKRLHALKVIFWPTRAASSSLRPAREIVGRDVPQSLRERRHTFEQQREFRDRVRRQPPPPRVVEKSLRRPGKRGGENFPRLHVEHHRLGVLPSAGVERFPYGLSLDRPDDPDRAAAPPVVHRGAAAFLQAAVQFEYVPMLSRDSVRSTYAGLAGFGAYENKEAGCGGGGGSRTRVRESPP